MVAPLLFSILPQKYKRSPAFASWRGKSILAFMEDFSKMARPNRPYCEVNDLCVSYCQSNPELTSIAPIEPLQNAGVDRQLSEESIMEFAPDPKDNNPILTQIKIVLARIMDTLEVEVRNDTDSKRVQYLRDYFIYNHSVEAICSKNGVTSEAVNVKMRKFVNNLLNPQQEDDFRFSESFIEKFQKFSKEISYSSLNHNMKLLGIEEDPKYRILNKFLKLDVLNLSYDNKLLVPIESMTELRRCLNNINQKLKTEFDFVPMNVLYDMLPATISLPDKKKLLNSFFNNLDSIEIGEKGARLEALFLDIEYLKQARIIFDCGHPMTSNQIANIYRDIYKQEMGQIMANSLRKVGFKCSGTIWQFGQKATPFKELIADFVKENDYYIRLSSLIKFFKKKKMEISEKSVETYLSEICYRSLDDSDIFCHKDHEKEFPEFRRRKEANKGQENKVVNALWSFLGQHPKGLPYNEVSTWVKIYMKNNGLNESAANSILETYITSKPVFKSENGMIYNNPLFDVKKLKYMGLGKSKEKYANQVISIAVNELQKSPNKEIAFVELKDIIWSTFKKNDPTRKVIENILRDSEEVNIENRDKRLFVSLAVKIESEPVYEVVMSTETTEPELNEIKESREPLTPTLTFDWDKILLKLEKELEFYVREYWFGVDFDLKEGLIRFKEVLSKSGNQNLSFRIPQDLYEYWFCATSHYDRNRYFNDLTICYERLLEELYPGPMEKTYGLKEVVEYFPALKEFYNRPKEDRLAKAFRDLNYHRNKVAHGNYVDLTSREEAEKIINYIALYVYTVATKGVVYR